MSHLDERSPRPLRIALTGGIASGKSTITDMFRDLGATIIDTDVIAREVVAPGQAALDEIREAFGDAVIAPDGSLDRPAMRKVVFSDNDARARLEGILHPRIREATMAMADAADGPYQIIVVPLLVGSPLAGYVDRILVVDCDEETQIRRLIARDAESETRARQMLAAQASREDRLALADDVIANDGDLRDAQREVRSLHRKYLALARTRHPAGSSPPATGSPESR